MSISHDTSSATVCAEVFDENSLPSEKEVIDYARRLGIDPDTEPHLLSLAREGLMAALPKGWTPVFDKEKEMFYYYQQSTEISTWEHPLDAVYKDLVEQARAAASSSNRRRASVEKDPKSDDDDNDDAGPISLPPPISSQLQSPTTRIPMKQSVLKRHRSSEAATRRTSEMSLDRLTKGWKSGDGEDSSSRTCLSSDRASRDYTNLRFQDPQFYEAPKLLNIGKKKLDLRDVLKRSESLSPRHEKDWRQLNNRFSSDENVIDIDNLSATSFGAKIIQTPDKYEPTVNIGQTRQYPKELTLSGGGSIFLKSNRSRETTPCQDETKRMEDLGRSDLAVSGTSLEEMSASAGERLKSILRDKVYDDDDRHIDEERKSVRFDLQKVDIQTAVTKFNDSCSDEESTEEEEDEQAAGISGGLTAVIAARRAAAVLSLQQVLNRQGGVDFGSIAKKSEADTKKSKIVGRRFVVENVSEEEHMSQKEDKSIDNDDDYVPSKFENVKNIDIVSRSDSEKTTPRSSVDSKVSFLDELRKSKEIMLDNMKKSELREKRYEEQSNWSENVLQTLVATKEGNKVSISNHSALTLDTLKTNLTEEHGQELQFFKTDLDARLEETKKGLEQDFNKEKFALEAAMQEKLLELKREMTEVEEREIQKLVDDMNDVHAENLKKVRSELEICYEKERQDILTNMKTELDQRKHELLELRSQEILKLESEHEKDLNGEKEIVKQQSERVDDLKKELEKEFEVLRVDLRTQQREKIAKITEDHEKCLADILRDFRMDESLARKVYKQRLDEIRADYSKDIENEIKKHNETLVRQDSVEFEKIRCEKRLLEDKYNTLKEKYMRLKRDMRAAIEKRNRRKEQQAAAAAATANMTASETEMSTSTRTRTDKTESSGTKSPLTKTNSISNSKPKIEISSGQNTNALKDQQQDRSAGSQSQKVQKFESDDTTTCSETTSNLLMMSKKKKCFTKKPSIGSNKLNNNVTDNPVENIRKQLEKLEDLGDQLPSNETAYTVRYPFQDKSPTNVSSELEFFKHRIHVERDSVRRAREALKQQKSSFQSRQRAWRQRSARATLEQLVKEERELSDMEVSLHRTRSLLGEKVIHLRHLEQSLERVANSKRNENETAAIATAATSAKSDEMTLSDMSSASSGFSSTDLGTDTFIESTEIIASLENLNSEIREIWGVLNKRQDSSMPQAPPTLMYTDLSWFPYQHVAAQSSTLPAFGTPNIQSNILSQLTAAHPPGTTQNIISQYGPTSGYSTSVGTVEGAAASNLIERTRNLKDWLRQARVENSDLISPGQATL